MVDILNLKESIQSGNTKIGLNLNIRKSLAQIHYFYLVKGKHFSKPDA